MTAHARRLRKAVLPVAGLGTRVLPGTKTTPKELLNVVDRPILSYIVEEAREAGIEHIVFVTGPPRGPSRTILTTRSSWRPNWRPRARPTSST